MVYMMNALTIYAGQVCFNLMPGTNVILVQIFQVH